MNSIQKKLLEKLPENVYLAEVTSVIIPLCFGDPTYSEDGCHERFGAGIKGLVPRKSLIIQTGGTTFNPLCDKMLNIVKAKRPVWAKQFLSICLGWGTRSEIANAFSIIEALNSEELDGGIKIFDPDFKVIISTNKAHMKRVKWFVKIYNSHSVHVEYKEAHHDFTLRDTLREYFGTPLIMIEDIFLGRQHLTEVQDDDFCEKMERLQ